MKTDMKSPIFSSLRIPAFALFLAVAILASVLTGCKAEVNVTVDEEGAGEIEIIGAVNDAILSLIRMGGEDPLEDILELPEEGSSAQGLEGTMIEPYSEHGYTGVRIRTSFDAHDPTLNALSRDDSMLGTLTESIGLSDFNFTRTPQDDGWIVRLNQSTDSSLTDEFDDFLGNAPIDIADLDLPFVFSLKLPGEYIEHNADREIDGALIWDTNLLEGVDISVVSRDPGLQIAIVPIVITAIFIVILGGIVISVVVSRERRRRRMEQDAVLEAAETETPRSGT